MTNLKEQINLAFNKVKFDEQTHSYYVNNEFYPSVSSKNKVFKNDFDSHKMAQLTADKYNQFNTEKRTKEYYLKEWKQKSDIALAKGKRVHNYAQLYPNFTTPELDEEKAVKSWFDNFSLYYDIIHQEFPLYSEKFKIAGTPDVITEHKLTGNLDIFDFKTGKDLYKNYDANTLKPPFQYLLDHAFHRYSLQQSYYKMMMEEKGFKINHLYLVWLTGDTFKLIEATDFTEELIKHHESSDILSITS